MLGHSSFIQSLKLMLILVLFASSAYAQFSPVPFIDLEYFYDGVGNVESIIDHIDSANSCTMQYDSLDRLTVADGAWGAGSFSFDSIGNRTSKDINGENITYTYGSSDNRLSGVTHDANGNIIDDGTFTYTYDSENRLIQVTNGVEVITYGYDGDGRRISQTINGETTFFGYGVGLNVLTEFSGSGVPKFDYIYAGSRNIARINFDAAGVPVSKTFYHGDHLGSTIGLTDQETTVVWDRMYLPYGGTFTGTGAIQNTHQYTAKELDEDTGLYYYGARYHNPDIGRFMSADPAGADPTDPQSWNRYAYTLNNPYKYIDPNGEAAVDLSGIAKVNTQLRSKLGFVPSLILDLLLPVEPEAIVSSSLPGPQALGMGTISKGAGLGLRRSAVITYERAEKFLIGKGFDTSRAKSFIGSFEGSITARIVETAEEFFRYTGKGGSKGSFLTKSIFAAPEEALSNLNLAPYDNTAQLRQTVTAIKRSIVLEGGIKGGASGTRQTLIIGREAFEFSFGERF